MSCTQERTKRNEKESILLALSSQSIKKLVLESLRLPGYDSCVYVIIADLNISVKLHSALWQNENHFYKFYKNTRIYIAGRM